MGKLTTHVLDTAHGRPAAGMALVLYRCAADARHALLRALTDADGRCAAPLLEGSDLLAGRYELEFAVGDYFAAQGLALPSPRFLDLVSLRFGIAEPSADYHVPLLVSPWFYSTYRGS